MDPVEILSRRVRQLEAQRDQLKQQVRDLRGTGTRQHMAMCERLKAEKARAEAAERDVRNMRLELDTMRNRIRESRKEIA